jgi:hypothetical protein
MQLKMILFQLDVFMLPRVLNNPQTYCLFSAKSVYCTYRLDRAQAHLQKILLGE